MIKSRHDSGVSVVIPAHNRAHTVLRAIGSCLHQTMQVHEVIVVDDASTDATAEIVAQVGDERVRLIRLDERTGGGGARQVGLERATSRFVAFLDSDDESHPRRLEQQIAALERSAGAVVATGNFVVASAGRTSLRAHGRFPSHGQQTAVLRCRTGALTSSVITVLRDVATDVGWDPEMVALQDYDFLLRILERGSVVPVPAYLVRKHIEPVRVFSGDNVALARAQVLMKHRDLLRMDGIARLRHELELAAACGWDLQWMTRVCETVGLESGNLRLRTAPPWHAVRRVMRLDLATLTARSLDVTDLLPTRRPEWPGDDAVR